MVARKTRIRTAWLVLAAALLLGGAAVAAAAEPRPQRTDLEVANLTCSSCLLRIRWEVKKLDGVVGMSGHLGQKIVRVDHAETLPAAEIAATLTNLGYPATVLATGELSANEAPAGRRGLGPPACGPAGCTNSRPCNATAGAWRELIDRWFGDDRTGPKNQP